MGLGLGGHMTGRAIIWSILGLGMATLAHGESISVSTKSVAGLMRYQLDVLDQRADARFAPTIGFEQPRAIIPGTPQADDGPTRAQDSPYLGEARKAARLHRVPEPLFLRLITQESGWNPGARSPKGAIGLAQLMPQTARLLRVDPRSPAANLEGGARYLRMMYDRFGSWRLALAAYNAGPEAVQKYRGVPPYDETRSYVQIILSQR